MQFFTYYSSAVSSSEAMRKNHFSPVGQSSANRSLFLSSLILTANLLLLILIIVA